MQNNLPDKAGVVAPPPLIYIGGLLGSLLLHKLVPVPFAPRHVPRTILGVGLIGLAITIISRAIGTMRSAGTNVNPEQPTTALVTSGPYQFTRNPLYIALTMLYTGLAVLVNTLWAFLLLPLVLLIIDRGVIAREERYLERKFGARYAQYKQRVNRWL